MPKALTMEEALLNTLWKISKHFPQHLPFRLRQDYFLTLVFYKAICDHWQEDANELLKSYPDVNNAQHTQLRTELLEQARFVIPDAAHFGTCLASSNAQNIGQQLEQALSMLEIANPTKLKGLFQDLPFAQAKQAAFAGQEQVFEVVLADLNEPECDLRPSRFPFATMVGQIFAKLQERFTFAARVADDKCPTPIAVAHIMASLLAPRAGQSVYDPACGAGYLLAACAQWIRSKHTSQEFFLFGEDYSYDNVRLARMQLLLLNIQHQLRHTESLNAPAFLTVDDELPQFDIALCHPPENIPEWLTQMLAQNSFHQFDKGIPDQDKAGFGFVLHMLACLKPETGRMAALLPYAALVRGGSDQAIRQKLLEANLIDAVICLPNWLFPHANRRYAIVILQHGRVDQRVCMMDASHIAKGNQIAVDRIADFYRIGRDVPGYARMVKVKDLIALGNGLDVSRFKV